LTSKNIFPARALNLSREIIAGYKSFNFTVRNRYDWGLVFKKDPEYVFYSSFDAVLGYVGSCPNQGADWGDPDICLIQNFGVDILKFHSAYLPLIMLKLGLSPLPDYLLAHGLIQVDGAKMSKSKNNAVGVDDLLNKFSSTALRLYLMRHDLFSNFDYNESEIEKIHLIYNKFIDKFLPNIKNAPHPLITTLDLFDTNICNFNFKANIDKFIDLIEEKDNFTNLDPAQTNFLLKFFIVFLSFNTK
jgi:methionyl-tRNA synthetase